jgi:hypothetical protein
MFSIFPKPKDSSQEDIYSKEFCSMFNILFNFLSNSVVDMQPDLIEDSMNYFKNKDPKFKVKYDSINVSRG